MKKKLISMFVVLAMVVGCFGAMSVSAVDESENDMPVNMEELFEEMRKDVPEEWQDYFTAYIDFSTEMMEIQTDYADVEVPTEEQLLDALTRTNTAVNGIITAYGEVPSSAKTEETDAANDFLIAFSDKLEEYIADPASFDETEFITWMEDASTELMNSFPEEDTSSEDDTSSDKDTSSKDSTSSKISNEDNSDNPDTGDAGVASVFALMAIAGGALLLSKKRA